MKAPRFIPMTHAHAVVVKNIKTVAEDVDFTAFPRIGGHRKTVKNASVSTVCPQFGHGEIIRGYFYTVNT